MDELLYPVDDEIYVLKEGRRLGPFTVANLLDGLESGDFSENDFCLRPGATDLERIRDLLDWEEEPEPDEADEPDDAAEEEDLEEDFDEEETDDEVESGTPEGHPIAAGSSNRLLYAGHPSALNYPVSLVALVGGITGGLWLYRLDPNLTLAGLALAVAGLVRLSFVRFTHDYHIRPRRIEVTTGFLARSSREVRIEDIRSINVTCRGILGMFGIGTVDFLTSGDTPEVSFERVWAARKIKALVRKLQDAAK
jgi:membrane protein YdbS with pleckstrin-like domain